MKPLAASPDLIRHVVLTMRAASAIEIFGNSFVPDRAALAQMLIAAAPSIVGLAALADDPAYPSVVVGVLPAAPGRGSMIFVANDGFPAIAVPAHRWWHRVFVPGVMAQFRRVEFTGAADPASGRWLRGLGFTCEGIARAYGKDGEDFGHWGWVHTTWRSAIDVPLARVG